LAEGLAQGSPQGLAHGLAEGLAQGLAEGNADISVPLLIFTHRLFQHPARIALSYIVPIR
jgi:hypothetical protein